MVAALQVRRTQNNVPTDDMSVSASLPDPSNVAKQSVFPYLYLKQPCVLFLLIIVVLVVVVVVFTKWV